MVFQNNPTAIKRYAPFHKALAAPTSQIDDAPYVCVRLNQQWLPFIIGALEVLRWPDLYKGTSEEITFAALEATQLFLAIALGNMDCMGDDMPRLRQNETEPCLLEISYDDGGTWSTAFDYSLCRNSQTNITITVENVVTINTEIENNMTVYEGDITNIYENWGYGDADDYWRDNALCWAARQFVELACDFGIIMLRDAHQEKKDLLRQIADGMMAATALAAELLSFGLFPAWASYAVLGAELADIAVALYSVFSEADISSLEDEDAKELVACRIYNQMKGSTPTFVEWSMTLIPLIFEGNAEQIEAACLIMMQEEAMFMQFFLLVGDMIDVGKAGADLGCPCETVWAHTFKFKIPSGSDPHTTYDNDYPFTLIWGEHVSNSGCEDEDGLHAGHYKRQSIIQVDLASRDISRVSVDFDYSQGEVWPPSLASQSAFQLTGEVSGETETLKTRSFAQTYGRSNWEWNGHKLDVTRLKVRLASSIRTNAEYSGTATIIKVVVEGFGTCPFD